MNIRPPMILMNRLPHPRYRTSSSESRHAHPIMRAVLPLALVALQAASAWHLGALDRRAAVRAGALAIVPFARPLPSFAAQPDYAGAKAALKDLIDKDPEFGPTLLRLAWHSSGTYDKMTKTGGSGQGTIRFTEELKHGGNAGLDKAVARVEPIHAQFPSVSYADLYTLAGVTAIEAAGGPKVGWRAGRVDALSPDAVTPDGRLPDADKGRPRDTANHLRFEVFYRMGFDDREIVALSGAHALGFCHPDASGYSGPWTPTPTTLTNGYYNLLLNLPWTLKEWDGPMQFEDPSGKLMMLPSDIVLIQDNKFRSYVKMYAKDQALFFSDFAAAFQKLEELGCKNLKTVNLA